MYHLQTIQHVYIYSSNKQHIQHKHTDNQYQTPLRQASKHTQSYQQSHNQTKTTPQTTQRHTTTKTQSYDIIGRTEHQTNHIYMYTANIKHKTNKQTIKQLKTSVRKQLQQQNDKQQHSKKHTQHINQTSKTTPEINQQ